MQIWAGILKTNSNILITHNAWNALWITVQPLYWRASNKSSISPTPRAQFPAKFIHIYEGHNIPIAIMCQPRISQQLSPPYRLDICAPNFSVISPSSFHASSIYYEIKSHNIYIIIKVQTQVKTYPEIQHLWGCIHLFEEYY